jgi:hypothetical protein
MLRTYIYQLAVMMILLEELVHLGVAYVTRCALSPGDSVDWPQEIRSLQSNAYSSLCVCRYWVNISEHPVLCPDVWSMQQLRHFGDWTLSK